MAALKLRQILSTSTGSVTASPFSFSATGGGDLSTRVVPLRRFHIPQNFLESRCLASTSLNKASSASSRLRMASERTALLAFMKCLRAAVFSASVTSGSRLTSHISSCVDCLCSMSSLVVASRPGVGRRRIFLVPRCASATSSRALWKLQSRMSAIRSLSTLLASRALMMPPASLIQDVNCLRHASTQDQLGGFGPDGGVGMFPMSQASLVVDFWGC